ncbi:MAG: hypothetical protein AB1486_07715 [Planctomycetota bacterium]
MSFRTGTAPRARSPAGRIARGLHLAGRFACCPLVCLWVSLAASFLGRVAAAGDDRFEAVGPEILVNTYTSYSQGQPHVGSDRHGNVTIAWSSLGDIHARMLWADGTPRTPEWTVNDLLSNGDQDRPHVLMNPEGDFAIVWNDWDGNDGNIMGVFGRLYDRNGVARTGVFRVNNYTYLSQFDPMGEMAVDGSFIVAWSDSGRDGIAGCYARRFDASANPLGDDFLVNDPNGKSQVDPDIGMNRDGYFVIAWTDASGYYGEPRDIMARTYNPDGTPATGEILVPASTAGMQRWPIVAMAADRQFVVTWQDESGRDGSGIGVFARVLDFYGNPLTGDIQVNQTVIGDQMDPAVACDLTGNFIVIWSDLSSGLWNTYARRYDAQGNALGNEFLAHTIVDGDQFIPHLAFDESGERIVLTYMSLYDIYARFYTREPLTTTWTIVPGFGAGLVVDCDLTGNPRKPYLLAASATPGTITLPGAVQWQLGLDTFFYQSFGSYGGPLFYGFAGVLNNNSEGQGFVFNPFTLSGIGFQLDFAALVLDESPPGNTVVRVATRPIKGRVRF